MSICSDIEMQHKAVETFSEFALLNWRLKQNFSCTRSMRNSAAWDYLIQVTGYHLLFSRSFGKTADETGARKREVNDLKKSLWRSWGSQNVVNTSWWWQCSDVSELSCRGEKGDIILHRLVVEPSTSTINIAASSEKNGKDHFETVNLFETVY